MQRSGHRRTIGTTPTTIVISAEDELPGCRLPRRRGPAAPGHADRSPPTVTGGGQRVFIDDTSGTDGDVLPMEAAATATRIEPRLRERRVAVKRAATRKRLKWVLIVVGVIAIVVATLAVLGSGLFAIDDVQVEGAVYTDPAALEAVVEDLRGRPSSGRHRRSGADAGADPVGQEHAGHDVLP